MKIRIISGHCLGGGRDVYPGDVIELEEKLALRKLVQGIAVEAGEGEPVTKSFDAKRADVAPVAELKVEVPSPDPAVNPDAPPLPSEPESPEKPARARGGRAS